MKWPLVFGAAAFVVAGLNGEDLLGASIAAGAIVLHLMVGSEQAELRELVKNAPKHRQESNE